jgi:hypothetical protein
LLVEQDIDANFARAACFWLGERHPVLGCTIEEIDGKLQWVRDPDLYRVELQTGAGDERSNAESRACHWFHLFESDEPPQMVPDFLKILEKAEFYRPCMVIRKWSRPSENDAAVAQRLTIGNRVSEIWLSIHHAFCDGAGGVQIINDWIQIYENLVSQRPPNFGLSALDEAKFSQRNILGLVRWKYIRNLPFQSIGLFGAIKFVFRKTATIPNIGGFDEASNPLLESTTTAMESGWLETEELLPIEQMAVRRGFNMNAKFLGDLYDVLFRWRKHRDPNASHRQWMRIILPINLRDIGDRRLSAANRSSLIQIDRRPPGETPSNEFYQSIQREIGIVLRYHLDRMFLVMIRLIARSNSLLKHVARNPKPRGLAVFTNLGRPFRRLERKSGSEVSPTDTIPAEARLRPVEIDFLAPLRMGTPVNFAVAKFQERLRVTLHFDPAVISRSEAQSMLRDYLDSLRKIS